MSTANLRGSFARRATVVAASTLTIGLLAAVAPATVTVSANAEVHATTSSSALLAGQLTARSLTPVIATTTSTRTTTTSRTVTRTPVVAPYAFGTKAYNKWWARYIMVKRFGWKSPKQYTCLVSLWNRESSWNHRAHNRSSGAYGIPQALPGRKMAKFGSDWRTNPKTQIVWGLGYIKGRYQTPCGAWSAFQRKGWY